MPVLDLTIVVVYLIGTVLFGAWFSKGQRDVKDYFVSGRSVPWWAIAGVGAIGSLLLLQAVLALVFGRRVADTTVGTLLAAGIQLALRTLIIGPFRLHVALARSLL